MPKITRDKRTWKILPKLSIRSREDCPYVDYPYNIERCNYLPNIEGKEPICSMDICPLRVSEINEKLELINKVHPDIIPFLEMIAESGEFGYSGKATLILDDLNN